MTALPMDKRQRPSAARMLAFLLLVLVIAAQLVGALVLKQDLWGEDGMVMDTRTAAWSAGRQYGSEVENGLAILNQFEPHQVSYLRSRGNPIEFIPCTKGRRGYTSIPEGVVHVCEQYRYHSAEVAVVLSHEIVHLERHDPDIRQKNIPSFTASSAIPRSRKHIGRALRPSGDFGPSTIQCGTCWVPTGFWMYCAGSGRRPLPSWSSH